MRWRAEAVIVAYAGLLYDKRVAWAGQRPGEAAEGGCYHLLTGYVRGTTSGSGGALTKTGGSVYFDDSFIRGVKQGRVYFAGIDFGPLQTNG
jgi:hypothetical protein